MIHPSHPMLCVWKCDICWYWVIGFIGMAAINILLLFGYSSVHCFLDGRNLSPETVTKASDLLNKPATY